MKQFNPNGIKVLLFLFVMLLIPSCQSEEPKVRHIDLASYNNVGLEHNKNLDNSFNELKALKDRSKGSLFIEDVLDLIEESTLQHTLNNHTEYSEETRNFIKSNTESMKATLKNCAIYYQNSNQKSFNEKLITELNTHLSANQRVFIDKIMKIYSSESGSLKATLEKFNDLELEIIEKSDDNELPLLLSSISVARHSFAYWNDNASKWIKEFAPKQASGRVQQSPNWKVVGGVDIVGATGFGVAASPLVIVPFIGWGAWLGGTATVAALSSVGAAVVYWSSPSPKPRSSTLRNSSFDLNSPLLVISKPKY